MVGEALVGETLFTEATAEPRVGQVSLAHLSIELGHLYFEDFANGEEHLREHFRQVAPWINTALASATTMLGRRARVSTCFLIDDYFSRFSAPAELIPMLERAATEAGLRIDYIARESGCAVAGKVRLAELVAGRLVAEPPAGSNGSRPPTQESGWLSNGEPSSVSETLEAMATTDRPAWTPPVQNSARNHSIFVDVELWRNREGEDRLWSCPFLASVWQLLRLGVLRHDGEAVLDPTVMVDELPEDWDRLPAVVRRNPKAAAFTAYRTISVLATRFLPIEHAVRTILGQVAIGQQVTEQTLHRAAAEGITLPPELVDRIDYVFAGSSVAWR